MNANSLLINEPPIITPPSLAKAIGLNEAIVLQRLHELLNKPDVMVGQKGPRARGVRNRRRHTRVD